MPNLRGSELLILVLLVVILFGAKRLPDAARGLGRSLRIFKAETKGLVEDQPAAPVTAAQTPSAADALPADQAAQVQAEQPTQAQPPSQA